MPVLNGLPMQMAATLAVLTVAVVVARGFRLAGTVLERRIKDALAGRHQRSIRESFRDELPAAAAFARDPLVRPVFGLANGPEETVSDAGAVSIWDVVREHPSGIFLTGEPGAGKTTALRWLQDRAAAEALKAGSYVAAGVRVPVYVSLEQTPNRQLDGAMRLRETIGLTLMEDCGLPGDIVSAQDALSYVAEEFGVLLLLDGLNMIAARSQAMIGVQEVMRACEGMPGLTVVVSSRADVGNATSLPEFRLAGLDSTEERVAFLSAHAQVRDEPEESGNHRYGRVLSLDLARGWLSNPLILWTVDQAIDRLRAPMTRTRLYDAYVDLLREKGWDVPLDPGSESVVEAYCVLEAHCYHTLLSRYDWVAEGLDIGDWESWMDRHGGSQEATDVLDHLAQTTDLVTRTAAPDGRFVFLHPTFVEFFAAAYLAERFDRVRASEQLAPYLKHPSLDNMLVFLAGQVAVEDRMALLDVLVAWNLELAADALAEWPDSELAYKLPTDGRLLVRAKAWLAALAWLDEHSDSRWAGEVATELVYHRDTRSAALTWLEQHPDADLPRHVARELAGFEDAREGALAWLRRHPADSWAWDAVLELASNDDSRRTTLSWLRTHADDEWAGRVASGLAHYDDSRSAVLEWFEGHPSDEWAGRVARELVGHADTRGPVLEWLRLQPDAPWAGLVARELAVNDETRWAAGRWLEGHPADDWAGRVASELCGYEDSKSAALLWLRTELGSTWASLVAWKLAQDDHTRPVMAGWLQASRDEDGMGRLAAELADHDDTRRGARAWLEARPNARWAGRVARQLAGHDETRRVALEWLRAHSADEWAVFVARKLASHGDTREEMVTWLESHPAAWGAGCVAAELAGYDDTRREVLPLLTHQEVRPWSAAVLAEHFDVRVPEARRR